MKENEILDEIHRFRAEHARESGYDIHKIFREIRQGTEKLRVEGWNVVSPKGRNMMETSYELREEPQQKTSLTQHEKMRQLYAQFNGNKEKCVEAYAEAERRGDVVRKSNNHNISPESYASRLFEDGIRKGWLC